MGAFERSASKKSRPKAASDLGRCPTLGHAHILMLLPILGILMAHKRSVLRPALHGFHRDFCRHEGFGIRAEQWAEAIRPD